MQIDTEDVSLLNMTYICRCSNNLGTYRTMGCKERSYADPSNYCYAFPEII